ncbi:uncharacterized protein HMPREF1541_09827 [Cyphellophora europaea CBS 101466]|uniref:Major facilitator superfamily (MFS) profile domain-containing protein n=1 Tax=Cyphellophora europaea (strain CBS 101466) TaxID=1220924 RepID=W2S8F8_CYPE1|nr:uncharacterized protein HMPREF1541_09827 [Cyphellophora europaea CBS 101466]ETN44952.1 hypothetical protein HMPREF1541_09827 [Cyphellophora europaea CBS 101466]
MASEATTGAATPVQQPAIPFANDVEKHGFADEKGSDRASDSGSGSQAVKPAAPTRPVKGPLWVLVVISILSSTFLFSLDNTIVAVIQPAIVQRFNAFEKLPWIAVGFVLGGCSMNLVYGKLYSLFDGKILYIVCVSLFEIGSAMCGAAPSMDILIVGRTICGVGGAGMYMGVMSLLSAFTTEQERPTYIGLTGLTWGAGTALGPIVGGIFTDSSAGWRWAFYLNLVVGGACAPVYLFLLPSSKPRPNESSKSLWQHLDWAGATLSVGAILTLVMGIAFGGEIYPWDSAQVIALFVVSGVLWISFAVQQSFSIFTTPELRLFPVHFILNKDLVILFIETASAATLLFLPIYFLPIYFQFIHNTSALSAGVKMLPFIFMLIVFSVLNGGIMSKTGVFWPWYTAGAALALVGSALLYTIEPSTSDAKIYGFSALIGIGAGCFVQSSFAIGQALVKQEEKALATGFITCGQLLGSTIALTIANTLFVGGSIESILQVLPGVDHNEVAVAMTGANPAFFAALDEMTRLRVFEVMVDAINRSWILCITAAALGLVLSIFLSKKTLFIEAAAGGA